MEKADSILIVGRGQSAFDFDWSSVDMPIMAISSGIFAIPRDVHCDHFVTLDEPRNFMAQLMKHAPHSWGNDPNSRYWPFWADPTIVKHVHRGRIRTVVNNPCPTKEIVTLIRYEFGRMKLGGVQCDPEAAVDAFYGALGELSGQFGLQPGWGDYQNVVGWDTKPARKPIFDGDGPLAIWHPRGNRKSIVYNTMEMVVQVAGRLGFKNQYFIGVDLVDEGYTGLAGLMKEWHKHAVKAGIRWINLSERSKMPGEQLATGVAA